MGLSVSLLWLNASFKGITPSIKHTSFVLRKNTQILPWTMSSSTSPWPGSTTTLCSSDTIFYSVFSLPFHTAGCHVGPPVCPAPAHLQMLPALPCPQDSALRAHLLRSNGTYLPDLSRRHLLRELSDQLISF